MQYLALNRLLRFWNENQLKSNKEYDDSLYAVLALVRTDQEKARYTFLEDVQQPGRLVPGIVSRHPPIVNEDVDYLVEDNAMDDICLSPELDGTLGVPTFGQSCEHQNF
jgi:DNA-directed RNA polymerase-5 subunit 1